MADQSAGQQPAWHERRHEAVGRRPARSSGSESHCQRDRAGAAVAGIVFPFPGTFAVVWSARCVVVSATRGGVSLYLDALAVAITALGLIRLAEPRSLRKWCRASRMRSF